MTQLQRAIEIHRQIQALDETCGRWENPIYNLPDVRVRIIDAGRGWEAMITTPFSGLKMEHPDPRSYENAVLLQEHGKNLLPNITDLSFGSGRKVMSVEWSSNDLRIIGFTPGPWETVFGFPARPWPASARASLKAAWPIPDPTV